MSEQAKAFFTHLMAEDNIGLVLRGHLHVEHQLIKYISHQLPFPERIDWGKIDYTGKVELALSCGLGVDSRPALEHLGALRNAFAHSLDAQIDPRWVLGAYNGLPAQVKLSLEKLYIAIAPGNANDKATTLDTRDLLVLIFISMGDFIQSELAAQDRNLAAQSKNPTKKT